MPRTRKPKPTDFPEEVLDHFAGPARVMTEVEADAITRQFKKALLERMLGGELTHHLGYPPGGTKPAETTNHRNGTSEKTVLTDEGSLDLAVPRDRDGTFEPQIIPKHARRFSGFDDNILALYARGMTVREIQGFLTETYAVEVSPDLMRIVTDAVQAEVRGPWGQRFPTAVGSWRRALRKIIKTRGHFPSDEAATKLIWLALRNVTKKWDRGAKYWKAAITQFAVLYEDRFTKPAV